MDTRENFIRTSLRLPHDLYDALIQATGGKRSLNAEIISRLEDSFYLGDREEALVNGMDALRSFDAMRNFNLNVGKILELLNATESSELSFTLEAYERGRSDFQLYPDDKLKNPYPDMKTVRFLREAWERGVRDEKDTQTTQVPVKDK